MTAGVELSAGPGVRPRRPVRVRVVRWAIGAAILIPALWAAAGLNLSWQRVLSAPGDIWNIVHRLAPPDLSPTAVQRALPKIAESFFIAWIGTIIGALFSFPLAFLAAKNVSHGVTSNVVRQVLNAIRAVPELLLAMVLIPVTGLGAWTGTLALGIHSIGTLGKLSSEMIEGVEPGPIEAIAGTGGGRFARVRFGIVPQVMPNILAFWLYRFEINIRASAVLGVVGAGGIGAELVSQLRFRDFSRAGTVLFLTIGAVLAVDAISARARRRIITGRRERGPVAIFLEGGLGQKVAMVLGVAAGTALIVFLLFQLQATA